MRAHTHRGKETWIGYTVRQLPTSTGLSPDVRCFTIYQSDYKLDLSETRAPPFSQSSSPNYPIEKH